MRPGRRPSPGLGTKLGAKAPRPEAKAPKPGGSPAAAAAVAVPPACCNLQIRGSIVSMSDARRRPPTPMSVPGVTGWPTALRCCISSTKRIICFCLQINCRRLASRALASHARCLARSRSCTSCAIAFCISCSHACCLVRSRALSSSASIISSIFQIARALALSALSRTFHSSNLVLCSLARARSS